MSHEFAEAVPAATVQVAIELVVVEPTAAALLLDVELLVELVESGLVAVAAVLSIVLLVKSAEFVILSHASGPLKFQLHVTACLLAKYPKSSLLMGYEVDSKRIRPSA